MKKLRIGIVGCRRGQGFVRVLKNYEKVKVTALCDIYEENLNKAGQELKLSDNALFTQYEEFLDAPIDVVVIATPIPYHTQQTVAALEAGKHVLCEQTVAYTVSECQQVVDAVKRSNCIYMMAENYSYFDYVRKWRDYIKKGKMGKIYYAEGEYLHEIIDRLVDEETGEFYWRHERPPIWYCAHTLGPLLLLMEDRIVEACGLTTGFNKMPQYKEHPGFLDFEIGLFKTEKNSVIKIVRSQVTSRPPMVWYSLHGTKGHLENNRFESALDKVEGLVFNEDDMDKHNPETVPCSQSDPDLLEDARLGGHGTSEYYMIRDFVDAVENNSKPPVDVIRATDMTIPGLIAHKSAMNDGQWLEVPLMG